LEKICDLFGKSQLNRYIGSAFLITQLVKGSVLYNQTELDRARLSLPITNLLQGWRWGLSKQIFVVRKNCIDKSMRNDALILSKYNFLVSIGIQERAVYRHVF